MPEYSGLVIAKCRRCKSMAVFYAKEPIKGFSCRVCRKFTAFDSEPVPVVSTCECGNRISGVTNSTDHIIEFNCKCGYPNVAEYSNQKHKYFGIR